MIGYTPDIFMGPLMGYLIDRSPGALGHQYVFGVVAAFAAVGLISTWLFQIRRDHIQKTFAKTGGFAPEKSRRVNGLGETSRAHRKPRSLNLFSDPTATRNHAPTIP